MTINDKEYRTWKSMILRCRPNQLYGSRGFTICARWVDYFRGFQNFLDDMGSCPGEEYTLDRIDNLKGYSPDNCRWADKQTQIENRIIRTWLYGGRYLSITKLARELAVKPGSLYNRLVLKGMTIEEAMADIIKRRKDPFVKRKP